MWGLGLLGAGRSKEQRRPRKKLYEPDEGDEKWQHDRFELLELPPDMDTYEVRPAPCSLSWVERSEL